MGGVTWGRICKRKISLKAMPVNLYLIALLPPEPLRDRVRELKEEIRDRFGDPPAPVETLFRVARLRVIAAGLGIQTLVSVPAGLRLGIEPGAADETLGLLELARESEKDCRRVRRLGSGDVEVQLDARTERERLELALQLLTRCA